MEGLGGWSSEKMAGLLKDESYVCPVFCFWFKTYSVIAKSYIPIPNMKGGKDETLIFKIIFRYRDSCSDDIVI